jgi:biopolymer transport protein ExbB
MKKTHLILTSAALLFAFALPGYAQSDVDDSRPRLEKAISELDTFRSQVNAEMIPLASKLRGLENEVIELRRERERMRRSVDNQSLDLSGLQGQADAFKAEAEFTVNTLYDFLNRVATSLSPAEALQLKAEFEPLLSIVENEEALSPEKLKLLIPGMEVALKRFEDIVGGNRFAGQAIDPDGRQLSGMFGSFGPVTYFAADSGTAGLVMRSQSGQPAVIEIAAEFQPAIASFVTTGKGMIPVDPTLGRALAIRSIEESPIDQFKKGGLWMWPIGTFGAIAMIIALYKFFQLLSIKNVTEKDVNTVLALLGEDKEEEARAYANKLPNFGGEMIKRAIANRYLPKELLEEFLFEILLMVKPKLERFTFVIALTASVAPLLGLLGTVTGMIRTFNLLTLFGTGDAKSLSSGISEALLTTAFGLIAAIPTLILAAIITRIAASKLSSLEGVLIRVSNGMAFLQVRDDLPKAKVESAATVA